MFHHIPYLEQTGCVSALYTDTEMGIWNLAHSGSARNYEELAKHLGITLGDIIDPQQRHTTRIGIAKRADGGDGILRPSRFDACDGVITNEKNLLLTVTVADCVPLYLVDPVRHAIGLVHSGWRGTAGEIALEAVRLMQSTYATDPSDLLVYIGPHICRDCYEVGEEITWPFTDHYSLEEIGRIFAPEYDESGQPVESKYLLDLSLAIRITLARAGVVDAHIIDSGLCTLTDETLFSRRRQVRRNEPYCNNLAGLMLR